MSLLPSLECLCIKANSSNVACVGIVSAKISASPSLVTATLSSTATLATQFTKYQTSPVSLDGQASIAAVLSAAPTLISSTLTINGGISPGLTTDYTINGSFNGSGTFRSTYTDKFAGDFGDFECVQKLYPIADIPIVSSLGNFVGPHNESSGLFSFIDEGVFTGDYDKKFGDSILIADDKNTFIHPSAVHTDGEFEYKCEVTTPIIRPDETRLRLRASAPISNYEAGIPPRYTIQDIKFEDPNGILIVQYEDIVLRGDANHYDITYINFTTYSSKALTNNTIDIYDWQTGFPSLHEGSGYTLYFKVKAEALDDAFDAGFSTAFEENYIIPITTASGSDYFALDGSPLSTNSQGFLNPTNSIKISAFEICNSGGWGPGIANAVNLYAEVQTTGNRIEREIRPSFMPTVDFDTGIWPTVSSVWYANGNPEYSNTTPSGSKRLISHLNNPSDNFYITLNTVDPILDSGKLIVRMSHGTGDLYEITPGAFDTGFDGEILGTCVKQGAFDREQKNPDNANDGFFVIDCVKLRVKAKKAVGTRDYVLDVVGYSDDCLLNLTSSVGGFLQNVSGIGDYPVSSGFLGNDDLGLSSVSMSEHENYFETSGNNDGGDHYSIVQTPIVSGTDYEWYEVPLKIYDDTVTLGQSRNYTMSSLFERLYVDIYPLPSGASFSDLHLLVRYPPQNALNFITQGGECIGTISDGRSEGKIYPTSRQANDDIINAGSGYGPLSTISDIPHAYTTPNTIKSNYSRRWRGMEGTTQGPFDPDEFSFSFYNPHLDFPYLSGFWDFNINSPNGFIIDNTTLKIGSQALLPVDNSLTPFDGVLLFQSANYNATVPINEALNETRLHNFGWRFKNSDIFDYYLPGYSGLYQTIDWTSLSSGVVNFQSHELYGKIADAFSDAMRVGPVYTSGDWNYGLGSDVGTYKRNKIISNYTPRPEDGFGIYTRFSPDVHMSGVGYGLVSGEVYNLWDTGVLYCKWDTGKPLEFALSYSGGYLRGLARDTTGTIHEVMDNIPYSGYQYPLGVILTYNDQNSSGLKLYTDNEFEPNWNTLRASSVAPFTLASGISSFTIGECTGSGGGELNGFRMFLTEFGITHSGNIVYENADASKQEVTAQTFLENNRVYWWDEGEANTNDAYTLWNNVDEDTQTDWQLGAFKYCPFSPAFDQLQLRTGRDLINFNLVHDGSGYIQRTDLALPSTIDSDVAYHTQIENDFLRFNLSDTTSNFHSAHRRITKDLPRGYKFSERALVVETILEHQTPSQIIWSGGQVGPKLIVSLYTKNQEPYWVPDEPNWGLINRDIHYLEPSSCITRVDSKFTYSSYCDKSEKWAWFPREPHLDEFTEKFYSQDVDDMFLQYDLVYPSGRAFESRIDIHTAHVRMDDALVNCTDTSGVMNIMTSGGNVVDENLNLFAKNYTPGLSGQVNLYTIGPVQIQESGFNLYTSGALVVPTEMNLFTESSGLIRESGFNLVTSGKPLNLSNENGTLNFYLYGHGVITSQSGDQLGIALTAFNSDTSFVPEPSTLPLYAFGSTVGTTGVQVNMPIFMLNEHQTNPTGNSGVLRLKTVGSSALFSRYRREELPLTVFNNDTIISGELNLTLYADNFDTVISTGSMNLYNANYGGGGAGNGSDYLRWFNYNYGTGIELDDNPYASKAADDEIRGVDLIGYGACDGDSPDKAIDSAVITDGIVWREETCNEGGIFRAEDTYTNLSVGYSGDYYDIRKYEGLIPHTPYFATLRVTTGTTQSIPVPNDWEEWEYGTNTTIAFSGIKLIADDPHITTPSGRNAFDKYGSAVAIKGDLMAVGSPKMEIPDISGQAIQGAGSVFLYRRGTDVPGEKADWEIEDQLILPSGYRRDYVSHVIDNLLCYPDTTNPQFCISGQKWNIGQEGREFGHSVGIGVSGTNETVVIGAPGAQWNRTFDNVVVSGIPICMMVFTDKFTYNEEELGRIANVARKSDVLYKYFSAPWNAGGAEFHPRLDIKLLVYQLTLYNQTKPIIPDTLDWFSHTYLDRLDDINLKGVGQQVISNGMLSGIKDSFLDMFPNNTSLLHSNVPPIVGIFKDNSASTVFTTSFEKPLNEFISFYEEYSFESGVIDPEVPEPVSGYINTVNAPSETFLTSTIDLLNTTLSTGNLIFDDALKFITSGVGQQWANNNAYDFQIPAPSGGRVYVFEKESGVFNLVQEIKSASEVRLGGGFNGGDSETSFIGYGTQVNNRFGHSVSISDNREIIAIGSPYTSTACEIYERNGSENTRMYNGLRGWLVAKGKTTATTRYDSLLSASGSSIAQLTVYDELTQGDKFLLRSDESYWGDNNTIQLYKNIYTYGYGNIPYQGTWEFIPDEFAGTSRLGYSTAVSEDGNIVAFGAPTDSFNEFDDTNVWYKNENTWASYTNAGAVRVFESRRYYPHNSVIEFYKFGNLDRTMHPDLVSAGFYDQMGLYFQPDDIPFYRTEFSELEIPESGGLAFIITPEVDAASDEIIDNIKTWLAKGDRTLVLVGNDPVWEENGLYKGSNDIVNKILKKLGSRMRIHPARNEYESLPQCVDEDLVAADRYNVVRAKAPAYGHSSSISTGSVFASGVGDIRIDLSDLGRENMNSPSPCNDINPRCEMPLKHDGDLRAQWNAECTKTVGNQIITVRYKENWPRLYGNSNPSEKCDNPPPPSINRPGEDIRPLLTAAEYIPGYSYVIPAYTVIDTTYKDIFETTIYESSSKRYFFGSDHEEPAAFHIQTDANFDLGVSGVFESFNLGTFFDPDPSNGGRDGIIQATGEPIGQPLEILSRQVSDVSVLATEETYFNGVNPTTSKVHLFASLLPESDISLSYVDVPFGDRGSNNFPDKTILFWNNLVKQTCGDPGELHQLGGWTGNESFTDAYASSKIVQAIESFGQSVREGIDYDSFNIIHLANVIWIANPQGLPSAAQISQIQTWLNGGDRRLVITYTNDQEVAENVAYICDQLNLNSKPLFSTSQNQGEYLVQSSRVLQDDRNTGSAQNLGSSDTITGCPTYNFGPSAGSSQNTSVPVVKVRPGSISSDENTYLYIPIKTGDNTTDLIYYNDPLFETYPFTPADKWRIDAESTGSFAVEEGSGYRIFANWVSEGINEKYAIRFSMGRVITEEPVENGDAVGWFDGFSLNTTPTYSITQGFIDVQIPTGVTSLEFEFNTAGHNDIELGEDEGVPATPRLISVSGNLLPIEFTTITTTTPVTTKIGVEVIQTERLIPAQTITVAGYTRPIKTLNDKYCSVNCNKGGQLIEDGPVVVAEEEENFSAGTAGANRSKIVVISDPTIIQGQCPHYRNDSLRENQAFIRSLYPTSPFEFSTNKGERRFEQTQKLVSPERGSPAKLFGVTSNAGLVQRFGLAGVAGSLGNYTDQESSTNPLDISRPVNPIGGEAIKTAIQSFADNIIPDYGVYPKFSGVIDGVEYIDAGRGGGIPSILRLTGHDYLDLDVYMSGYPGDLFGYSVGIHENKLVVGSPFNAYDGETVTPWDKIEVSGASGLQVNGNGGAGAVFYYEKTGSGVNAESSLLNWEFKNKIKPSSINVGIDNATTSDVTNRRGMHNLNGSFVINFALLTDQFGHSVAIDQDMLAIGAPNHDFETIHNHIYSGNAAFIRKEFTCAFDIPKHVFYDLGSSGVRYGQFGGASGTFVMNNGAVFTYRHQMTNWQNRTKEWVYAEKKTAQGYSDRNTDLSIVSGTENDKFGTAVAIDMPRRGDGDYTMIVGSPFHKYATSGTHGDQPLEHAGAAYTYDAMLREQVDSTPNSGNWIRADVFGDRSTNDANRLTLKVYQNTEGEPISYEASGIIFSNINGDIFLEASGIDLATKSYVAHRPYVESVIGEILGGTPTSGSMIMFTSGTPVPKSGEMNLTMLGADTAIVYNNVNLYTTAWNQIEVGSGTDPFKMYVSGENPTETSGIMNLHTSGTIQTTGNLDLRVRGR